MNLSAVLQIGSSIRGPKGLEVGWTDIGLVYVWQGKGAKSSLHFYHFNFIAHVTGEVLARISSKTSLRTDSRSVRKDRGLEELSSAQLFRFGRTMNSWGFGSISPDGRQSQSIIECTGRYSCVGL